MYHLQCTQCTTVCSWYHGSAHYNNCNNGPYVSPRQYVAAAAAIDDGLAMLFSSHFPLKVQMPLCRPVCECMSVYMLSIVFTSTVCMQHKIAWIGFNAHSKHTHTHMPIHIYWAGIPLLLPVHRNVIRIHMNIYWYRESERKSMRTFRACDWSERERNTTEKNQMIKKREEEMV